MGRPLQGGQSAPERHERQSGRFGRRDTGAMTKRRPRYKRGEQQEGSTPPVVLPHVVVRVEEDGTLGVTVDGESFEPESFAPAWHRSTFGGLIAAVTEDRRVPVRVEVREVDGTTFTDIITPGKPRLGEAGIDADAPRPELAESTFEVTGEGFVPGEDVAVAIILSHTDAAPAGTVRTVLATAQLEALPTGEVVLLGRASGTFTIRRPR